MLIRRLHRLVGVYHGKMPHCWKSHVLTQMQFTSTYTTMFVFNSIARPPVKQPVLPVVTEIIAKLVVPPSAVLHTKLPQEKGETTNKTSCVSRIQPGLSDRFFNSWKHNFIFCIVCTFLMFQRKIDRH